MGLFIPYLTFQTSSYNADYNTSDNQYGYTLFLFNITNSSNLIRETTYSTYQPQQYQNVTVISKAFVTRILFEGASSVGVEYIKEGQQNLAYVQNEIILSAGAISSPKILMLSGIGDENELRKFDIPVVANVPEVGKNLYDDLFVSVGFSIPENSYVPFYSYSLAPAVIFGSTKNNPLYC
ncbi:hypothetical protein DSM106972_046350 [Dulcicalothrix desertica PCC 7102]|uniref:Glucose-methanol-choline oxidoreductase N-terminal domain-containing protein n=1 Tax=Dulcicalothrix desertica PCC 7102 TaxID=232991 RepID=A0A433VEC3_9CYAN|nr:GMC family oxidoreductase N-terminal domain-containing protein [Dulcicalothrix desertica]RUT04407.1 hypothetical protein DSM106972_046350 [Dulcicalothrix desertica PCC 7102]